MRKHSYRWKLNYREKEENRLIRSISGSVKGLTNNSLVTRYSVATSVFQVSSHKKRGNLG